MWCSSSVRVSSGGSATGRPSSTRGFGPRWALFDETREIGVGGVLVAELVELPLHLAHPLRPLQGRKAQALVDERFQLRRAALIARPHRLERLLEGRLVHLDALDLRR